MVHAVPSSTPQGLAGIGPAGMPAPGGAALGQELFGQGVAAVDSTSVFANAMDELTASLSERTQEKKLRERKLDDGHDLQLQREQLRALLDGLAGEAGGGKPDQARQEERQALARQILDNPALASQRIAHYTGGDPTEQYLLARELGEMLDAGEVPGADPERVAAARHALREAAAEVFAEHSGRVLADVNTYSAMSGLPRQQAQALRGAYQDAVLGGHSLAETLRKLIEAGGEAEGFLQMHQSMVQALGLDLAAARSSTDKVKLQALASDLFQMATIGTTLDRCRTIGKALGNRYQVPPLETHRIASDLIAMTGERWVDGSRFTRLAERYKLDQPPACAVEFLQAVRTVVSGFPVQVFQSGEARSAMIDSLQSALDAAIDREEGAA